MRNLQLEQRLHQVCMRQLLCFVRNCPLHTALLAAA
jgi:hypothetical protein